MALHSQMVCHLLCMEFVNLRLMIHNSQQMNMFVVILTVNEHQASREILSLQLSQFSEKR